MTKQATVVREKSVGARGELFARQVNANAVVTFIPGRVRNELFGVCWSYSATPTNGRLTIFGGGFNFDIDITTDGPGFIPFPAPMHATNDTNIVVTLYAGGVQVVGKLNVLGKGTEDSG
jgi:hypothetical protein